MNLTSLTDRPVEWLKGGPESDVVVSSRVRLARNVDGHPFVWRASDEQRAEVEKLLRDAILSLELEPPLTYTRLDGLDPMLLELLLERRLISTEQAEGDWTRGVAFDEAEQVSIMVNEEDHLRLQVIRSGSRLQQAYRRADEIDDALSRTVRFAYSEKYGYLTACPTNVGTGMRASVMLHLPAIVMAQEMDRIIRTARERRLAIRGVYGEGTHGAGDFYQVSNHVTLGASEDELIETVARAGGKLAEMERTARLNLYRQHRKEFEARIRRAFELLCSASAISSQEALNLLSQVRMGAQMNVLEQTRIETLNKLFLLTLPAHLQTMKGAVLDNSVADEVRASYVKAVLTSG